MKEWRVVWHVVDDSVSIRTTAKTLEVVGGLPGRSWSFPIEHTCYTGQHTVAGRRLAERLARALNDVETHRAAVEVRLDESGRPWSERTPAIVAPRVRRMRGMESDEPRLVLRRAKAEDKRADECFATHRKMSDQGGYGAAALQRMLEQARQHRDNAKILRAQAAGASLPRPSHTPHAPRRRRARRSR